MKNDISRTLLRHALGAPGTPFIEEGSAVYLAFNQILMDTARREVRFYRDSVLVHAMPLPAVFTNGDTFEIRGIEGFSPVKLES